MKLLVLDQFSDPAGAQQCLLDLLPAVRQLDGLSAREAKTFFVGHVSHSWSSKCS